MLRLISVLFFLTFISPLIHAQTNTTSFESSSTSISNNATDISTVSPTTTSPTTVTPTTITPTNTSEPTTATGEPTTTPPTVTPTEIPTTTSPTFAPTTPVPVTQSPTTSAPTTATPTTAAPTTTAPATAAPTIPAPKEPPSRINCAIRSIHDGTSKTAYRVSGPSLDNTTDIIITLNITIRGDQIWQPILIHQSDIMWGMEQQFTQLSMYVEKKGDGRQVCVTMGHGDKLPSASTLCSSSTLLLHTPYTITFHVTSMIARLYVQHAMVNTVTLPHTWITSNASQWAIGIHMDPILERVYFNGEIYNVIINDACILPTIATMNAYVPRNKIWRVDQNMNIDIGWQVTWNNTRIQYPTQALLPTMKIEMMPRLNPPFIMTVANDGSHSINFMTELISHGMPPSWVDLLRNDANIYFTITSPDQRVTATTPIITLQYPEPTYDNGTPSHLIRTATRLTVILLQSMDVLMSKGQSTFEHEFISQLASVMGINANRIIIHDKVAHIRPTSIRHNVQRLSQHQHLLSANDEAVAITFDILHQDTTRWDGTATSITTWINQSLSLSTLIADLTLQLSSSTSKLHNYNITRLISTRDIPMSQHIIYCADAQNMAKDCERPPWVVKDVQVSTHDESSSNLPVIIAVAATGTILIATICACVCVRSYRKKQRKTSDSKDAEDLNRFRALTASSLQMESSSGAHYAYVSRDAAMSVSHDPFSMSREAAFSVSTRDPAMSTSVMPAGWMSSSGEQPPLHRGTSSADVSPHSSPENTPRIPTRA